MSYTTKIKEESFFSSFKVLAEPGYLKVAGIPGQKKNTDNAGNEGNDTNDEKEADASFFERPVYSITLAINSAFFMFFYLLVNKLTFRL